MSKLIFSCLTILVFCASINAQQKTDEPFVYSRILSVDSLTKGDIFDKVLIWCSKAFKDSKSAINVKNKESGIVGGKASFDSNYKIPKKKDSVYSTAYNNYIFDWLIEIKDSKARISLSNIMVKEFSGEYPVTINGRYPIKFAFTSQETNQLYWELAKEGLVRNIDNLVNSLYADLQKKDNW